MWVGVISLFPEMFRSITDFGVTGQAVKKENSTRRELKSWLQMKTLFLFVVVTKG